MTLWQLDWNFASIWCKGKVDILPRDDRKQWISVLLLAASERRYANFLHAECHPGHLLAMTDDKEALWCARCVIREVDWQICMGQRVLIGPRKDSWCLRKAWTLLIQRVGKVRYVSYLSMHAFSLDSFTCRMKMRMRCARETLASSSSWWLLHIRTSRHSAPAYSTAQPVSRNGTTLIFEEEPVCVSQSLAPGW
jgi:hypothetical protein